MTSCDTRRAQAIEISSALPAFLSQRCCLHEDFIACFLLSSICAIGYNKLFKVTSTSAATATATRVLETNPGRSCALSIHPAARLALAAVESILTDQTSSSPFSHSLEARCKAPALPSPLRLGPLPHYELINRSILLRPRTLQPALLLGGPPNCPGAQCRSPTSDQQRPFSAILQHTLEASSSTPHLRTRGGC